MPLDKLNPAVKDDHSNEPPIRNFSSMLIDKCGENHPAQSSSAYQHFDQQEHSGAIFQPQDQIGDAKPKRVPLMKQPSSLSPDSSK